MTLTFIVYYLTYGGIERQITFLANEMQRRGHNVSLISLVEDNRYYEIEDGIHYYFVPDSGSGVMKILNRYHGLIQILKKIKSEVTISFMFQSAYFCAFGKKSISGKILYSERGDPGSYVYRGLLGLVRKLALPRMDYFVFQTSAAQSYFSGAVQKRSAVIPNPVYVRRENYPPATGRKPVIVNVGRLCVQKNQAVLIQAFEHVHRDFPEFRLHIYGEGELKNALEQQISALGLEQAVSLMGTSSKWQSDELGASLFVLSSNFEGMPNVLLEAMALGIPCISTDYSPGGVDEIIQHGVSGMIVSQNDPQALSQAMLQVLKNPDLAESLGLDAQERIRKNFPEAIYDQWEEVFFQLKSGIGRRKK